MQVIKSDSVNCLKLTIFDPLYRVGAIYDTQKSSDPYMGDNGLF